MRASLPGTRIAVVGTLVLAIAVTACEAPSEPRISGACIGVTNVGGQLFVAFTGMANPGRTYEQGEVVATVTRHRRCDDTPDPTAEDSRTLRRLDDVAPLAAGESNHLDVGTRLCAIKGEPADLYLMICDRDPLDPRILTTVHDEPIF